MFQKISQCSVEDFQWVELDKLDDSQLVDIFNRSTFDSLMTLADRNQRFRALIVNTANSKYHIDKKSIRISTKKLSNGHSLESVEIGGRIIEIHGNNTALKFLQIFGPKISVISIEKDSEHENIVWDSQIDRYINEYCSDSLRELKLFSNVNSTDTETDAWKKPFKQLTNLYVFMEIVDCEHTNSSEIFPSLSFLNVEDMVHFVSPKNQIKLYCF